MVYKSESTTPSVEVLFSVPKRNHKRANKRNTLKRRMREAYRLNKDALHASIKEHGTDVDIAFVYSTKDFLQYKTIEHAVRKILAEVAEHM